jgi:hypothetical protein
MRGGRFLGPGDAPGAGQSLANNAPFFVADRITPGRVDSLVILSIT